MMNFKSFALLALCFCLTNADSIREIRVKTADCDQCGMTFLGELSVKVCGQGPGICCVATNLDNSSDNFIEGQVA